MRLALDAFESYSYKNIFKMKLKCFSMNYDVNNSDLDFDKSKL